MTSHEPAHLRAARTLIGTRELPGIANSKLILAWAMALGARILGIAYGADSVPWCGLFVAHCLRTAGVDLTGMKIAVRASAWAAWGTALPASGLVPGAILVFTRAGGGHVGFYVGEDATHYFVLGGNQGDAISIMRIAKSRCTARRWPVGIPLTGAPVRLAAGGVTISTNEG